MWALLHLHIQVSAKYLRTGCGSSVHFLYCVRFLAETVVICGFKEDGKYSIVTIKNVQDNGFEGNNVDKIDEIPNRMPQYCYLKQGDILLSLTGNVGRVCRVSQEMATC